VRGVVQVLRDVVVLVRRRSTRHCRRQRARRSRLHGNAGTDHKCGDEIRAIVAEFQLLTTCEVSTDRRPSDVRHQHASHPPPPMRTALDVHNQVYAMPWDVMLHQYEIVPHRIVHFQQKKKAG
jgi:hypothetical protein